MNTWQRALTYGVALVAVFGVAIGIGRLAGPIEADTEEHGHDAERVHLEPAAATYELDLEQEVLESGRSEVAFRVLDARGESVTSYDVQHEKQLHLIAVRRDLAEFRHVHPRLDASTGRWSVPVDLDAGAWRLYADFAPAGAEPALAEADLMVGGPFDPQELGPDTTTSRVGGFEVHLERDAETSMVTLHVTRDGEDVTDLQPYLGAYGHLVAIRADDLGYLHVHPEEGEPGPEVGFHAEFAEPGRYRLFLDFKHGGRVHTADFTITVEGSPSSDSSGDHEDSGDHEEEGGHGH